MNDTQGISRPARGLLGRGLAICSRTVHGTLAPLRWLRIGMDETIASGAELREIVEHVLERRMVRALHWLQIPTFHDVRELSARVAALQAEVAALEAADPRPGHAPRTPAKTATHEPRRSRPPRGAAHGRSGTGRGRNGRQTG